MMSLFSPDHNITINLSDMPHELQDDLRRMCEQLKPFTDPGFGLPQEPPSLPPKRSTADIRRQVNELGYAFAEFSIAHYTQFLQDRLGCTIESVPFDLSPATAGACLYTHDKYSLFYTEHRHALHQEHTVIHESAHILLNHLMPRIVGEDVRGQVDLYLQSIQASFRSHVPIIALVDERYRRIKRQQEAEAEAFARVFSARVIAQRRNRYLKQTQNINLFPPFSAGND